jgi:hypothetical protein
MKREFDVRDEIHNIQEFIVDAKIIDSLLKHVNRSILHQKYGMIFKHRVSGTNPDNDVYVFIVEDDKKMSKFCLKYEVNGSLVSSTKLSQKVYNLK